MQLRNLQVLALVESQRYLRYRGFLLINPIKQSPNAASSASSNLVVSDSVGDGDLVDERCRNSGRDGLFLATVLTEFQTSWKDPLFARVLGGERGLIGTLSTCSL